MFGWQAVAERWLNKRIPEAHKYKLNYRSIFIFPSRFGGLFLLLCLGLFILGSNYQNNLMIFLCYFLLSLFLLNLFIAYLNFAKLEVQLGKVKHGFAGEKLQIPIWIHNNKRVSNGLLKLNFWKLKHSVNIDLDDSTYPVYLPLDCEARGKLKLPRVTLTSTYPLGLISCWTHLAFVSDILIYPKPLASKVRLISKDDLAEVNEADSTAKGHDDFDSLAPYKQGEPLYHVAWKQVAKGQGMISKQFSNQSGATGWLMLASLRAADIEQKLSELCFQVIELTRNNSTFGLDLGNLKIEPSSGTEHQNACLKALALHSPYLKGVNA
ncbi:DUF58 domain-containing protein [Aliiglaciecola sp. 3_MG-2023]|uniref:DUF58 domain-containing protein n=1 Tax=Aliiglaciecola sp. 3_MG-2023 TaxID=3062644 RepID=UPI0026E215BC|nr:DUF58 domain-containing protein [Aliiglaciecola sp. 3_MG-2023]MDO6695552.1 DUF58 domain-containing protein [Aliiglaciecola sp. 3_MG-2023]